MAKFATPKSSVASLAGLMKRKIRSPQYTFNLAVRPWQIQPFLVAPVWPNETMKNLLLQSRVVSKPVKSALIGWWCEYYFFYVKFRDLDFWAGNQVWQSMFLDPEANMSSKNSAAAVPHYHGSANQPNYSLECLKVITERFFRDESEAWNSNLIDTLPVASVNRDSWLDSVHTDTAFDATDLNVDLDASGTITASEINRAQQMYDLLNVGDLSDMSFEEFLTTYGIKPEYEKSHKPELLRYIRSWSYPTNTVEPTTGVPSSALSWSIAERADKDRKFKEPGFIFAVQVVRPKVYFSRLIGSAVDLMNSAMSWLPAVLSDDPTTSLVNVPDNVSPFANNTDAGGAWVDIKDLAMYGDQYINHALTDINGVALPSVAYQHRYADSTDADGLFAAAAPANTCIIGSTDIAIAVNTPAHANPLSISSKIFLFIYIVGIGKIISSNCTIALISNSVNRLLNSAFTTSHILPSMSFIGLA